MHTRYYCKDASALVVGLQVVDIRTDEIFDFYVHGHLRKVAPVVLAHPVTCRETCWVVLAIK